MRKKFPAIGTFISWSSLFNPFLVQACQSWRGGASDPNPRPKTANQFPHPSSFSAALFMDSHGPIHILYRRNLHN